MSAHPNRRRHRGEPMPSPARLARLKADTAAMLRLTKSGHVEVSVPDGGLDPTHLYASLAEFLSLFAFNPDIDHAEVARIRRAMQESRRERA